MKTLLSLALVSASIASAHATPVTAMSCVSQATKTFVTVGISTEMFGNEADRILAYNVHWGKLGKNGEVASEKTYEQESNMKIFGSDEYASKWVHENTVVIPLYDGKTTTGALLVDTAKKKVTLIDTDYETIEKLGCLIN